MTRRHRLSFVIPVFNETANIREMYSRLSAVIAALDAEAEMIFVDDGSTDETPALLAEVRRTDSRVKIVSFARNFGHQVAITAGLELANGDAVVVMDGDLQDPPEAVPQLVQKWEEGYEIVYAIREKRLGESWLMAASRRAYYRTLNRLAGIDIPLDVGDFRLVDRRAVDAFLSLHERNRYLRGMFSWIGFRQIGVPCDKAVRHAGQPKYSWGKLVQLGLNGVISFSEIPLRIALFLGFIISIVAFVAGLVAIASKIAGEYIIPGWASIAVLVTFLGGVQLLVLGMMGLYVGRIHDEVKARPLYVVRDLSGFGPLETVPSAPDAHGDGTDARP